MTSYPRHVHADMQYANHTMEYHLIESVNTELGEVSLREVRLPVGIHYELRVNGIYVMATYCQESESELAWRALELVESSACTPGLRVLVGGLGMGITARETLNNPSVNEVVVVEIEPKVVEWCGQFFGPFNGNALDDVRTRVIIDDIARYAAQCDRTFDAILLDMDNGPQHPILPRNRDLYNDSGLRRWHELLRPGGVLSVWAAKPDTAFVASLEAIFERVYTYDVNTSISLQTEYPDMVYCAVKHSAHK